MRYTPLLPPPASSRKTLIYLILTLNHIYPDYDFTLLRAQHFWKEESLVGIQELVSARLLEAAKVGWGFKVLYWYLKA